MSGSSAQERKTRVTGGCRRNRSVLLIIVAAVLAVMVIVATFGVGYILGAQNSQIRSLSFSVSPGRTPAGNTQSGEQQQGQKFETASGSSEFTLSSDVGTDGGTLPAEYTSDGTGSSPALSWSNPPAGTKEYALMMTTIPVDGATKWNWVLFGIPGTTTSLAENSTGGGITGVGSHGNTMAYQPPASQGPGPKIYTFTLYALSQSPQLPGDAGQVTGEVLTRAISPITLGSASLNLSYTRP